MELSLRLQAVADMVTEGRRVADIGCDHGYVSIYLCQKKRCPKVIAMDVKNSPARYGETVGITPFDLTPVKKSIALLKTGRVPYEFRTTVSKTFHDAQSLKETGELIEGADFWYLQAFKNSGNLIDESIVGYDENSLHNLCNMLQGYAKHVILRGV